LRVNFELDWMSMTVGVILAWITFRVRKIFRLWKIKETSAEGLTVHNGEYKKLVGVLDTLLQTDQQILGAQMSLTQKVDGLNGRVGKIEAVLPGLAQGH
jgi:hypothetical protein